MHAEKSAIAINQLNQKQFIDLLEQRMPEMEKDSQKTRLQKVIKKVMGK